MSTSHFSSPTIQTATNTRHRSSQLHHNPILSSPSNDGGESDQSDSNSEVDLDFTPRRELLPSFSSNSSNSSSTGRKRKRSYICKIRNVKQKKESNRKAKWMNLLMLTDNQVRTTKCCLSLKCFETVDLFRLRQSMTTIFASSRQARRTILCQMFTSSGYFCFDGKRVCSMFLIRAFTFSSDLQTKVRVMFGMSMGGGSVPLPPSTNNSERSGDEELDAEFPSNEDTHYDREPSETDHSIKRDAIITFLRRIADATANLMPDNNERHLPFVNKISVFHRFKQDFDVLYPDVTIPSQNYFYFVWKRYCFDIKVRKAIRFSKCTICEHIRNALLEATARNQNTDALLQQQSDHLQFISNERLEYKSKVELAKLKPLEYLSIVVDGADQSAYTLPHFVFDVKGQRGLGMKVHLIGLLNHAHKSVLQLYTMTDEHQTGSNHIVEVIHRFINEKAKDGPLPRKIFIQLDNCSRENKNKYLMSYLDALVRWEVFDDIEVGFLPVGHTHCDIDQAFSSTSTRLKTHDAITLDDMHDQLRQCYNERTSVMDLKQIANWSGLCNQTNCCNDIDNITHYRFFKFSVSQTEDAVQSQESGSQENRGANDSINDVSGTIRTNVCRTTEVRVRHTSKESWILLESVNGGRSSFLRVAPDLKQTPPEEVTSPKDCDKISARIQSEVNRIGSEEKVTSLLSLRDEVFQTRSIKFHWDLEEIIEMKATNIRRKPCDEEIEVAEFELNAVSNSSRLIYDLDSFVAVIGEQTGSEAQLWIGRIIDRIKHNNGTIRYLIVHWYESYGTGDMVTCKYRPIFLKNKSTNKKDVPWTDKISCDSILNCFPTLTSQKRLPIIVANDLRERIPSTQR